MHEIGRGSGKATCMMADNTRFVCSCASTYTRERFWVTMTITHDQS